jgi:hypothetical protein
VMPTKQLDALKPQELLDLMKYLQLPKPLLPKPSAEPSTTDSASTGSQPAEGNQSND